MDPNLFTSWHALVMLALPGLIALVCKPDWNPLGKLAVALVFCFVAATIELALAGTCTFSNLPAMFAQVAALVFGSYAGIWKTFDTLGLLTKLENKGNV